MLTDPHGAQIYLAVGATDLRKSVDALAALVQYGFALDPFAPAWFVFCNLERDKLKILRWDHNGFWLYYRRLERGHFQWPRTAEGATRVISRRQLQWLLDGLTLEQHQAHAVVTARTVL
jgi:transposase